MPRVADNVPRGDAAHQARHAFWQFYAVLVVLVGVVAFGPAWLARRDDVRFERDEPLGDLMKQAAIVRDVVGPVRAVARRNWRPNFGSLPRTCERAL